MQPSFPTPTPTPTPTLRRRPPLSRQKRAVFFLLMVLGTYLVVEAISFAVVSFHFRYGGWATVQTALEGAALDDDGLGTGVDHADEVVHPYGGFVRQPLPASADPESQLGINSFGFRDREPPLHVRSRDKVIIGILGGSVAEQFGAGATGILQAELQKSPSFAGKELVFVRLGLSGYKQPQQFLTISYLLSLGGQFDILINLDGYNEIVLPVVENIPNHVFAAFPRGWHLRVNQEGDIAVMREIGHLAYLRERRREWARLARTRPFCYSATVALMWRMYHDRAREEVSASYRKLNALTSARGDYAASGPPQKFTDNDDLYEYCAQVWERSSLQLHQLCQANGIAYYHFLQPNQYVPDSKTMTGTERTTGWNSSHPGKIPVETGYPHLLRAGESLTKVGVSFTDLTMIFRDHPEAAYNDPCCHLNQHGNDLVAQKIAEVIRKSWRVAER